MLSSFQIIGIDCAVAAKKTGIASGYYDGQSLKLDKVLLGAKGQSVAACISRLWDRNHSLLLAIDAPLGWPQLMGYQLNSHNAGEPLAVVANNLFRRQTDLFVQKQLRKTPLDVGADRIARTAHAALGILQDLRMIASVDIGLAWTPESIEQISAIEVYPAGTLVAHGIKIEGYKKSHDERRRVLEQFEHLIDIKHSSDLLISNCDALDSAICLIAGKDFIDGSAYQPEDLSLAQKEGWIWFRKNN